MIDTFNIGTTSYNNLKEEYETRFEKFEKAENSEFAKEINTKIKELSEIDNKDKLKDPNFIVKTIRWFRTIYYKLMVERLPNQYSSDQKAKKDGFFNRLLGRVLKFVDKLMAKLQKLVDRRTFEQISNAEKFDEMINDSIQYKNGLFDQNIKKDYLDKDSKSKYKFTGDVSRVLGS